MINISQFWGVVKIDDNSNRIDLRDPSASLGMTGERWIPVFTGMTKGQILRFTQDDSGAN